MWKALEQLQELWMKVKNIESDYCLILRSVISSSENRRESSSIVASHLITFGIEISQRAICRRLVERGYSSKPAAKRPMLRKANVKKRLECGEKHKHLDDKRLGECTLV